MTALGQAESSKVGIAKLLGTELIPFHTTDGVAGVAICPVCQL
jgi:hypothetical protein